jgi:ABC-2 type transport system ATP-binding protein
VVDLRHSFDDKEALKGVSLAVHAGEVHALIGPNGAGKTTLLRALTGLIRPQGGEARIAGVDVRANDRALRQVIGLVPSGDRSFYLRLSGLENLVFFGRLYGLSRKEATGRARTVLAEVGLEEAAGKTLYAYSHGMQKRLSVARALLPQPRVLLVDEATHDLDLDGAERVRALARSIAAQGSAVIWTTQRLDEVRGFADRVTLLSAGAVRFQGTVPEFISKTKARAFVLEIRRRTAGSSVRTDALADALQEVGEVFALGDDRHVRLLLGGSAVLSDAVVALERIGVAVVSCREERSEMERAFRSLVGGDGES